jgi:hypothetical protein
MMHDHERFLRSNPIMAKFQVKSGPPPTVPDAVKPIKESVAYEVTDVVHTLPAGLWDSNVVSTYEFSDLEDGLFVRIRSPLSVVMDTTWTIQETEDGQFQLVEDVFINCSRLLVGVVKGQCEGGWKEIHENLLAGLPTAGQKE